MSSNHALSESRMLKLMAYADGELEGADRAEVERWLATDVDAVRFANEIAGLGDLVKTGHADSAAAKAVASFDITDTLMAAVKAEKGSQEKSEANDDGGKKERTAPVVSLDAVRVREGKGSRAAAHEGRVVGKSNYKVGAVVAAALALAASVFLMTRTKEEAPMARAPVPAGEPSPTASAEPGVDVDLVESAGDSVRVFYLSNETSASTSVVVWVDESGGK